MDPDSSASRTQIESILMPSLPNHAKFLTGPTAAEHWKKGRAVTPDLGPPKRRASGGALCLRRHAAHRLLPFAVLLTAVPARAHFLLWRGAEA